MQMASVTPGPSKWGGEAKCSLMFDREGCVYPPHQSQTDGYQFSGPIAAVAINSDAGGEANGRLIAAAPTLLNACKWVHDWLSSFSMPPTSTIREKDAAMAMLAAAIQDATGEAKR